jgi:hypothetical protein
MKRGLTYAEALSYVGVRRRTFDEQWRPHLVAIPQGSCLIFDKTDLDRLFDEKKAAAADATSAANDSSVELAQNGPRNGRPMEKGTKKWAKQPEGSIPQPTEIGKSTSGGEVRDFASVASAVLKRQKAG